MQFYKTESPLEKNCVSNLRLFFSGRTPFAEDGDIMPPAVRANFEEPLKVGSDVEVTSQNR